jgi:hypothetical protein
MRRQLCAVIGLHLLAGSQALTQSVVPWQILGDTTGAPHGCRASDGAATISLFLAAMRKADSAGLVRYVAPHFVFSTGRFAPSETFFAGRSIPELLEYARDRSRARDRMTVQAVWFNGWRGRNLQFGPIWFLRYADDLGSKALPGSGKGAYRCGEGIVVLNLGPRPAGDPGPDRYRGVPRRRR